MDAEKMSLRRTIIIIVVALALIIAGAAIWLVSKAASAYEGGETVRIYVPAFRKPGSCEILLSAVLAASAMMSMIYGACSAHRQREPGAVMPLIRERPL